MDRASPSDPEADVTGAGPGSAGDGGTTRARKPLGLVFIALVWGSSAVFYLYLSFNLNGPQFTPSLQLLVPELVMQDYSLRLFLQFLSLIQLFVAYEVFIGGTWSYPGGLFISAADLAIFADLTYLYYGAPSWMDLPSPLLLEGLAISAALAAVIWVYFNVPRVNRYLTRWW